MESATPRVEIELDEQEPKRSRRRAAHRAEPSVLLDAPPPVAHDVEEARPSQGAPRNQLVVTALAVGLVALFLGWVLGRAGAGDDTAAPATSPAPGTTAASRAGAATDDTLPEAELPTTTRPRPTTTTSPPPAWEASTVVIDPRLAGQTDRLVGETSDGHLVELDLASGEARILPPFDFTPSVTAFPVVATDDWIMVRSDSATSVRIYLGDAADPLWPPISDPWSIIWAWGTDRFWSRTDSADAQAPPTWTEIDVTGQPTGVELDTDRFFAVRADPAGGIVISDGASYFRMDEAGRTSRLPGMPIAMSAGHLLSYVCGDTIEECGLRLVDRATNESRPVGSEQSLDAYSGVGFPVTGPTVTSDGGTAIVPVFSSFGSAAIAILDLETGVEHEFDALSNDTGFPSVSAVWSTDERFAYVLDSGVMTAFDRSSGESFPVIDASATPTAARELLRLQSLTRRVPTT